MRKTLFCLLLMLCQASGASVLAASVNSQLSSPLYNLSIIENPQAQQAGVRYFREVSRTATASVVEAEPGPGSVAGPMFIVRGGCGLMRARDKKAFEIKTGVGATSKLQVTFPDLTGEQVLALQKQKDASPDIFSEDDCTLLGF